MTCLKPSYQGHAEYLQGVNRPPRSKR